MGSVQPFPKNNMPHFEKRLTLEVYDEIAKQLAADKGQSVEFVTRNGISLEDMLSVKEDVLASETFWADGMKRVVGQFFDSLQTVDPDVMGPQNKQMTAYQYLASADRTDGVQYVTRKDLEAAAEKSTEDAPGRNSSYLTPGDYAVLKREYGERTEEAYQARPVVEKKSGFMAFLAGLFK